MDIVQNAWNKRRPAGDLGSVASSLKGVVSDLKSWSSTKFGNVLKDIEKFRRELEVLNANNASMDLIRIKNFELEELLYHEEMLWLQRSRITWLKEGDHNTKFFHRRAVWRARKNHIRRLRKSDGS